MSFKVGGQTTGLFLVVVRVSGPVQVCARFVVCGCCLRAVI